MADLTIDLERLFGADNLPAIHKRALTDPVLHYSIGAIEGLLDTFRAIQAETEERCELVTGYPTAETAIGMPPIRTQANFPEARAAVEVAVVGLWNIQRLISKAFTPLDPAIMAALVATAQAEEVARIFDIPPEFVTGVHLIHLRPNGWTLQHPLSCRPNLLTCPFTKAAEELLEEPYDDAPPGVYPCRLDHGTLVIGTTPA